MLHGYTRRNEYLWFGLENRTCPKKARRRQVYRHQVEPFTVPGAAASRLKKSKRVSILVIYG